MLRSLGRRSGTTECPWATGRLAIFPFATGPRQAKGSANAAKLTFPDIAQCGQPLEAYLRRDVVEVADGMIS
ncbi:hypothetical protein ERJ75_001752800 [Trypanosoma vivax]|nr:hypothetical protein ERJ75_001752800 [Trypanosoma vivax]